MNECIFCKIIHKELNAHVIYEDELVICFLDIEPINEGHVLVVPKKHILDLDEIDDETTKRIMDTSKMMVNVIKKTFQPHGYSIMQNGGVFNDIGHYHLHVFPRYHNDGFGWTFREFPLESNSESIKKLLIKGLD